MLMVASNLQVDVNGAVHAVLVEPGALRDELGEGGELVNGQVLVGGDLGEVAIHEPADLGDVAVRRRRRRAEVVVGGVVQPWRRIRGVVQVEVAGQDPLHGVDVVGRCGGGGVGRGGRDEEVVEHGLAELRRHSLLEVEPARQRRVEVDRGAEQHRQEAHRQSVPLPRQQAHDRLEHHPLLVLLPRAHLLPVPPHDECPHGDALEAPRLHRDHDALERVDPQRRQLVGAPVVDLPRRRGAHAIVAAAAAAAGGAQRHAELAVAAADDGRDGVDAPGDEPRLLLRRREELLGLAEHGDRALEARQRHLLQVGLRPADQVARPALLGHLEVLAGATQHGDVVHGDLEVDAVAELDDELERLGAAGHAGDLQVRR
ncbi:Os03g0206750, partial [Oryza sativa Japonica Group]